MVAIPLINSYVLKAKLWSCYGLWMRLNIILIIIIEIILTACAEMPTPLRTFSDEWAFFFLYIRFTSVVTQTAIKSAVKIIIFYLSQNKCTVSALFLHGFKGCNGYSDLQNTTKRAEITT